MRYRGNSHDLSKTASRLGGGPITVCDYSGFLCDKADTVKQMAYNGSGLYDTGFVVHKKFADIPNPQTLTPPIYLDPLPVLGVKYDSQSLNSPLVDTIYIDVTQGQVNIDNWQPTSSFTFIGASIGCQCSFINSIFQMWFVNKSATEIVLNIQGYPYNQVILPVNSTKLFSYNMVEWKEILT